MEIIIIISTILICEGGGGGGDWCLVDAAYEVSFSHVNAKYNIQILWWVKTKIVFSSFVHNWFAGVGLEGTYKYMVYQNSILIYGKSQLALAVLLQKKLKNTNKLALLV